jgi:MFS family permease
LLSEYVDLQSHENVAYAAGVIVLTSANLEIVTEKVGRRWSLQISNIVFLIGAVIMTAATHQLSYIYAGRILTGLACGAITATVPSYIAELSITSIRGILTGLFEVTYQSGSLIGFWINYGINENMDQTSTATWRIPMAVQIIPSGILLIFGWFLHESPLWLFRKNRDDEAFAALEALRQIPRDHQCTSAWQKPFAWSRS